MTRRTCAWFLTGESCAGRPARRRVPVAVAYIDDRGEIVADGRMPGRLVPASHAAPRLRYDPIFVTGYDLHQRRAERADKDRHQPPGGTRASPHNSQGGFGLS